MASPARRRVKGDRAFRKLLNRMPEAMRTEMLELLDGVGDELLGAMQADVPARTGSLRSALAKRLLRGSLRLRVGLVGRAVARRFFYGRIVELGRKAQTVRVTRKGGRPYAMRVRGMAPRPFVQKRRGAMREAINRRINAFWDGALTKAAQGASDE